MNRARIFAWLSELPEWIQVALGISVMTTGIVAFIAAWGAAMYGTEGIEWVVIIGWPVVSMFLLLTQLSRIGREERDHGDEDGERPAD